VEFNEVPLSKCQRSAQVGVNRWPERLSLLWHRPFIHRVLVLGLLGVGCLQLATRARELAGPAIYTIYRKDVLQDYLLARALLDGSNPYVNLTDLAQRYVPGAVPELGPIPLLAHVSPHLPLVALLWVPFGLLTYEAAAASWLALEVGLLLLLAWLLSTTQSARELKASLLVAFGLLLVWNPVQVDLQFGQLSIPLALLLVSSYRTAAAGRPMLAGFLLGTAIAVKLFPLALTAYFALKGRWSIVAWSCGSALLLTGLAAAVLGGDAIASYVRDGLRAGAYWQAAEWNYSVFGLVWRSLAGGLLTLPLVDVPAAAWPAAMTAFALIWITTAWLMARSDNLELGFSLGLCAILLSGLLTWEHYGVLAALPIVVIASRLSFGRWPRGPRRALAAVIVLTVAPFRWYLEAVILMLKIGGHDSGQMLPGYAGLPLVLLPLASCLLYLLVARELIIDSRRRTGSERRWAI